MYKNFFILINSDKKYTKKLSFVRNYIWSARQGIMLVISAGEAKLKDKINQT